MLKLFVAKTIDYQKFELPNGLKVLVIENPESSTVNVTTLFNVGAKHEDKNHTGFAHLFEHLMFGGSQNVENFDKELEKIGGYSNAYTTQDYTNYYTSALSSHLETLLWLESDRMNHLFFDQVRLNTQKKVVTEEYRQRYLGAPYGDFWLHAYPLVYGKNNPYGWSVIGDMEHISKSTLEDVKKFFYKFYRPNNAILAIAGGVDTKECIDLVERWYSDIPQSKTKLKINLEYQPIKGKKYAEIKSEVPYDALGLFFNAPNVKEQNFYPFCILMDILSSDPASPLIYTLEKEKEMCISISAFNLDLLDLNSVCVFAKIKSNFTTAQVEQEILKILKNATSYVTQKRFEKALNQKLLQTELGLKSNTAKANSIAFYELIGDPDLINTAIDKFKNIKIDDVKNIAQKIFSNDNYAVLHYYSNK